MFDSFEEHTETIHIADNSTIQVIGRGTMVICAPYKNGCQFISKGFNVLINAEGLHLHALDNSYLLDSDHKYFGLQIDPSKMEEHLCEACVKGKISRAPIQKKRISNQAVNFGDILHMDLWGPSPVCAPGGFQYTFTILDEATGWLHEPKMRTKDEAFGRCKHWMCSKTE
ncbi:hypothetical protein PHLCEN_2v11496 [Hermanssonia centrifuga]|uniref:Retrovirus-related Pol polyprotein from transposon TNT 1-94 n=1 Tax=Hermanssonia centrifuga TaxID=98765 RepID=A0A2R6NKU2_9APHY|nr:hypothetical protein PHLCEN_2v11496 [Hermanssonia centrifuga]